MVFLTPLFLLGLFAALIPVAIHLIRREKPPKMMFSTVRFLKKTSRKLVLFQHLQQLLLLALRAGLIALLVFAFARPLINQSVARLLDSDPQSAVLLLDVSMSMRYEDVFEDARNEALDLLGDFNAGDEVALVTFDESVGMVREFNTDLGSVGALLREVEPGYGATNFMPALRLANQLLESSRFENRALYLISDFQEGGMANVEEDWKLAPGIRFGGIDVGVAESVNLTLTDVRSPEQLLEDELEQQILARVRSTGSLFRERADLSLFIDGQVVDSQSVELDDRSERVVSFNASFPEQGSHIGRIELAGDDFFPDNSWYFTVDVLPGIRILLINGESSDQWFDDEGHWFALAVGSSGESPFRLQALEPAELSAAALAQNDVAVLLNVGALSDGQAGDLADYVRGGGALLIAPGDQVDPEAFNRQFAGISPATLASPDPADAGDYLVIADYDRRHPVFRSLDTDWSARFQDHWRLAPNAEADVLMQFDNAMPALVEQEFGEGKVLLFASSMDLEWNNLPLQGLFLPFVHETLRHLVQPELKQRSYQVGDRFSVDINGSGAVTAAQGPDGAALTFGNENFVVEADMPGIIQAQVDGVRQNFAVNTDAGESTLARVAVATLTDAIINPDTDVVRSREVQMAELVEELERPQRIWWWILGLAMLLLLAESVLANRTYR